MPFVCPLEVGPEGMVGACMLSIVIGRPIIQKDQVGHKIFMEEVRGDAYTVGRWLTGGVFAD
jgi:hypothetical protein